MATKKKNNEKETSVSLEEPVSETAEEAPVKKATPRPRPSPRVKRISFSQYAVIKRIANRHRPGLTAFVKYPQKKRSIEEWDECFKNY